MYVEAYADPYERQADNAAISDETGPELRDGDESPVEEAVLIVRHDAAGRIPYEDLC